MPTQVQSFIPSIWKAAILENYMTYSRINAVTYDPQFTNGDKIIINRIGDITVKDYDCDEKLDWERVSTTATEIPIDQHKHFAFRVCDIEKVQAAGPLTDPATRNALRKLYKDADVWGLAKMANDATNKVSLGALEPDNVYAALVSMNVTLDSKDVPRESRYILISPEIRGMLTTSTQFTHFQNILENGVIEGSTIDGVKLVVSNDLPANTIISGDMGAFAFGYQIREIEAMRLQDYFADGVRGLHVYGGGVVRQEGLLVGSYTKA